MLEVGVGDGVATVTMDRPPVNAMSSDWVERFNDLLDELGSRGDWSVLHLRSALRTFSAGADLKEMRTRLEAPHGIEAQIEATAAYQDLFARVEALACVTIAEVGGTALGGGFELALACDLRIAAEDAKLGLPETRLGLLPGAGGTQRLTRLCGPATALRLILGAEVLDGAQAERLGLVHWSAPAQTLAATASAIARRIAELPGHAVAAAKSCIGAASDPARDGFAEEREHTRALLQDARTQALVRAFLDRVR